MEFYYVCPYAVGLTIVNRYVSRSQSCNVFLNKNVLRVCLNLVLIIKQISFLKEHISCRQQASQLKIKSNGRALVTM